MTRSPSLAEDLSYIRDLAEAGQNAPLLGGRFLVMWGALITLAYTGHFLIATGMIGLGPDAFWMLWCGVAGLGVLAQIVLSRRFAAKACAASIGNRVQADLWTVAGFFLFAYFAGVIGRIVIFGTGLEGFVWSVPVVIGLYGIGQLVTGLMTHRGALKFAGVAALFAAALAGVLSGTHYVWLVGAAAAFLAVFIPGIMMMRAEPSETV